MGPDRLLLETGDASCGRVQGANGMPSGGPCDTGAGRISRGPPRAKHSRWSKEIRRIKCEFLPWIEFLPGHGEREPEESARGDLRCDPLFRLTGKDLQRSLP